MAGKVKCKNCGQAANINNNGIIYCGHCGIEYDNRKESNPCEIIRELSPRTRYAYVTLKREDTEITVKTKIKGEKFFEILSQIHYAINDINLNKYTLESITFCEEETK